MRDISPELEARSIQAYGINPAGPESHEAFRRKYGLNVPLLVDEGGRVARAYGATGPGGRTARAVYLVDRDGIIRFSERGLPPLDAVLAALDD